MGTKDRPRRLGRGLSSLVGEPVSVGVDASQAMNIPENGGDQPAPATAPPREEHAPGSSGIVTVDLDRLIPSPFQARESFDEAAIQGLAESIRRSGLMQPVVARRLADGRLELVAGERRWRAARAAGLAQIPVIVRDLSDEESAELGVVENVQREDLNPIERARAFVMLATFVAMLEPEENRPNSFWQHDRDER